MKKIIIRRQLACCGCDINSPKTSTECTSTTDWVFESAHLKKAATAEQLSILLHVENTCTGIKDAKF